MASLKLGGLPAIRRQHLLAEFTGLKQACPEGVYVGLAPGDPSKWYGVIFVRNGPYAPAVLRFQISFPDSYPRLPPLVTFATDMFHPLITPPSTHMRPTDIQDSGTGRATDVERLPPGGFSLRHGFPDWFESRGRGAAADKPTGGDQSSRQTPHRPPPPADLSSGGTAGSGGSAIGQSPGFADTGRKEVSAYAILQYIRSTFEDEDVLDSVPLEAAGNQGAWSAWRTNRMERGKTFEGQSTSASEWNWEGVWEDRVKKGIANSLSESVLFGGGVASEDPIHFLNMGEDDVRNIKNNLLRTLAAAP
ncbi:ubiquitin-conjugating enzyme [Poronia punctata]|nr:ubiquitin-conjugating enzyme [Poronia punctata]